MSARAHGAQQGPWPRPAAGGATGGLSPDTGSALVGAALTCVRREYPHKLDHVLLSGESARSPRRLHPAFYGSYDWHSAVHNHWLLAYALRRWPGSTLRSAAVATLNEHLTPANLMAEHDYFAQPANGTSERPYGWAWLLRLGSELALCPAPEAPRWREALQPLADLLRRRCLDYLSRLPFPVRTGTHGNTAFTLCLLLEASRQSGDHAAADQARELAVTWYGKPPGPGPLDVLSYGDFLSPALTVADLMSQVLGRDDYAAWLGRYLPDLGGEEHAAPAVLPADPGDPAGVHLDGLHLSRAWCLEAIAAAVGEADARCRRLTDRAQRHAAAGLRRAVTGNFLGDHWLPTFAAYLDARRQARAPEARPAAAGDVPDTGGERRRGRE